MKFLTTGAIFSSVAIMCGTANAMQYDNGRFALRLTGYGTGGILERLKSDEKPLGLADWRARVQANYAVASGQTLGAVYAIDEIAIDNDKFMREAFMFYENRDMGRMEFGFTDSIARKLSVGLPDVGGLRVNDNPLFYKKITPDGTVIGDTMLTTGRTALRVNVASVPTNIAQYGLSVSGITDDYDYAIDGGIKIRQPYGKLKSAISLGASFMSKPDGYSENSFTPNVTADWRAQASVALNLQYNSWIFGLDTRVIYDRNPIGPVSDGITAGAGVSYDLLKYSVSLSYILSDTGIWDSDVENYLDNTVLASFRYKYSENVDGWLSLGLSSDTPFLSVAMRITF